MEFTKKLLAEAGIEPERLEMFNMSASMGPKFAETANEMTDRVRKLGPSPLRNGQRKDTQKVQPVVKEKKQGETK